MKKNGQISELSNDICHSDLYFFYCGANDRLGCIAPRSGSGVFLEFHS